MRHQFNRPRTSVFTKSGAPRRFCIEANRQIFGSVGQPLLEAGSFQGAGRQPIINLADCVSGCRQRYRAAPINFGASFP